MPNSDLQTRRALRFIVKLWGVSVLATGAVSAAIYLFSRAAAVESPRQHVARYLRENGFAVRESDIVVAGGLGSNWRDSHRPVVFLGAHSLGRRLDLWVARMRLSPAGVPLEAKFQNASSTFLLNEKKAAVSREWLFWEAPEEPGLFHLAWLSDVRWRLHLKVYPVPDFTRMAFDGETAILEGAVGERPVHVRVHPGTRIVQADGVQAELTTSTP